MQFAGKGLRLLKVKLIYHRKRGRRLTRSPNPPTMSHGHNNLLSTMSSYQAFRVRGLPSVFNAEAIAVLLQSVLGCEADSLTVNSLGLDPYSEESVSQVATITLGRLPKCLEDRKNDWPLTVKAKNPADNLDICFSVTLDTHFMGFTPLNAAKDYCDYAIE
jgi:hypothetical protein